MILKKRIGTGFFLLLFSFCLLNYYTVTDVNAANLPDFRELAKKSGDAVVNISTEKTVKDQKRNMPPNMFRGMPNGDLFEEFFNSPFGPNGGSQGEEDGRRSRRSGSLGSGFIISSDGFIVTNNHVVEGADVINVNLSSDTNKNKSYKAKLVGADPETDLALIKIEVKDSLPFLKFGDSDKLEVGEWVIAIGNPFGLDHSVTAGIISAKGRDIQAGAFDSFLQTDASINPGNSGGPLLNMDGEVIGINTAIVAQGQGIGFAIPSNMANKIIDELKNHKKVSRGWIGVQIQPIDEKMAKALGLQNDQGALLGGVMPKEPADKAGLMAGDVVVGVDNKDITSADDLLQEIANKKPGNKVELKVIRNGETKNFVVTLAERNLDKDGAKVYEEGSTPDNQDDFNLGIQLRSLNKDDMRRLRITDIEGGLLITAVEPDKEADKAGIKPGDVILTAALKPVLNTNDFVKIINGVGKERGAVMLQMMRRGQKFFVTLDLSGKK
ncbi:Do family serine endopeptidase [Desulfovibrio litoralis]|uniref:Probable periplasmic serine endoprotease DegP-like n=1 Tax=Desulfovibrio litoralis DSM 11393 TaxID=1121455 RepID=A0A1M7T7G4_9BACT|nr:Do family serine endopeptidase [Desulfovibrio litoralis]SHN66617.1 serine protease Do [Desulfovibrio litoralis DSM 11393]